MELHEDYEREVFYPSVWAKWLVGSGYVWPVDAVACEINGFRVTKEQYDAAFEDSFPSGDN